MKEYDHKSIEKKWKQIWEKTNLNVTDIKEAKKPFYNLMMFPYPSAEGMHVGSMYTFSGVDTFGRFKRMQGFDVFEPIGLDGFGIHSENYAIKIGEHIKDVSERTEKHFYQQLKDIGNMFDWSRTVETYKPDYYKWTQWLFIQMYNAGLAYRKSALVNWCPSCKTVLSDEQVISGHCERCDTEVTQQEKEQWFFKITDYAERLLANLDWMDWDEGVKLGQRNWIGKKEGINIHYKIESSPDKEIDCFTTRPDTNFGATFIVVAPEYPGILELSTEENVENVKKYIATSIKKTAVERQQDSKDKTGVFTGSYALNPLTNRKMPIYVADYVLMDFGTGAVVGVPAHDRRDFDFAVKYNLDIIKVVEPPMAKSYVMAMKKGFEEELVKAKFDYVSEEEGVFKITFSNERVDEFIKIIKKYQKEGYWTEVSSGKDMFVFNDEEIVLSSDTSAKIMEKCKSLEPGVRNFSSPYEMIMSNDFYASDYVFEDEGRMVNSDFLNGLHPHDAIDKMMDYLEKNGWGKREVSYKLRDWCVSRQRYWGAPIPMINCGKCGWQVVEEADLPVELPVVSNYDDILPDGTGKPPLAKLSEFVDVDCPNCGGKAKRETDVLDAFVDSCWYFLRYPSVGNNEVPFDPELTKKWLPVDEYIGGKEHTVLHLLYARFITMALYDQGRLDFEEPFKVFFGHGLITKDGAKMSKSRGNVVNPDEWVEKVGADTMRMYFRFMGDFGQGGDWRDDGIMGMSRFVKRIWRIDKENVNLQKDAETVTKKYHQMLKKVTEDIESLRFNTAVAMIMEFINSVVDAGHVSKELWTGFIKVIAPFMPYIAEELWVLNGGNESVHLQTWPDYDKKQIVDSTLTIAVQINGKLRDTVNVPVDSTEEFVVDEAQKLEKVNKYIGDGYKKVIYVQNRILNFIV